MKVLICLNTFAIFGNDQCNWSFPFYYLSTIGTFDCNRQDI